MKTLITVAALMFAMSFTTMAMAQAKGGLKGKVSKVDGTKITVTAKDGTATEVTTDDKTKFTLDGKDATLADVKEGQRATVTPSTGTATEVKLTSVKAKKPATAPSAG